MPNDNILQFTTNRDSNAKPGPEPAPPPAIPQVHHLPVSYVVDAATSYARKEQYLLMLRLLRAVLSTHRDGVVSLNNEDFKLFRDIAY